MPLKKIVAHFTCDKCDAAFSGVIANDAQHDPGMTVFELALGALDFVEVESTKNTRGVKEAGSHDGEIYCPTCWKPLVEEIFIADIRAGKVPFDVLDDFERKKYGHLFPASLLPAPETADAG